MDIQDKNNPKASPQPSLSDGKDDNLSNYLTYQEFREMMRDLKQEQFENTEHPQLATIKPLHWDYLRFIYDMIKAAGFKKSAAYFYLSRPAMSRRR